MCVRERERKKERVCEREREKERECVRESVSVNPFLTLTPPPLVPTGRES